MWRASSSPERQRSTSPNIILAPANVTSPEPAYFVPDRRNHPRTVVSEHDWEQRFDPASAYLTINRINRSSLDLHQHLVGFRRSYR
jgi:hypothetical protein